MGASRSVAKNTLLLTVGLMSGRLLALFLQKKMAPILGPAGLGIWFTAIGLTAILQVVVLKHVLAERIKIQAERFVR